LSVAMVLYRLLFGFVLMLSLALFLLRKIDSSPSPTASPHANSEDGDKTGCLMSSVAKEYNAKDSVFNVNINLKELCNGHLKGKFRKKVNYKEEITFPPPRRKLPKKTTDTEIGVI